MDPRSILFVARHIRTVNGESYFRSVVSRSYYAAFNVADQLLVGMSCRPGRKDHHQNVQNMLARCGDEVMKEVGIGLGRLHQKRIRADYDMEDRSVANDREADSAISNAERLMTALDAFQVDLGRKDTAKSLLKKLGY